jgi:hypothetical protein
VKNRVRRALSTCGMWLSDHVGRSRAVRSARGEPALLEGLEVCGLEVLVAPADASELGGVGEDAVHGRVAPAGRGRVLGA